MTSDRDVVISFLEEWIEGEKRVIKILSPQTKVRMDCRPIELLQARDKRDERQFHIDLRGALEGKRDQLVKQNKGIYSHDSSSQGILTEEAL